jgi:hypothetical protein
MYCAVSRYDVETRERRSGKRTAGFLRLCFERGAAHGRLTKRQVWRMAPFAAAAAAGVRQSGILGKRLSFF